MQLEMSNIDLPGLECYTQTLRRCVTGTEQTNMNFNFAPYSKSCKYQFIMGEIKG